MSKYRIQVKVELIECNDDSIENDLGAALLHYTQ